MTCHGAPGGPSAAHRTRTGADLPRLKAVCSRQSAGPIRACRGHGAVAPWQREGYRTSAAHGGARPDRADAQAEALRGREGAERPLWGKAAEPRPIAFSFLAPRRGAPSQDERPERVRSSRLWRQPGRVLGGRQPAKVRYAVPYFCLNLRLRHGHD